MFLPEIYDRHPLCPNPLQILYALSNMCDTEFVRDLDPRSLIHQSVDRERHVALK